MIKKRKTAPLLTAAIAESTSAWPVSKMRVVCGWLALAFASSSAPFMPGMRMSEMTTAACGCRAKSSRAAAPLVAVSTS